MRAASLRLRLGLAGIACVLLALGLAALGLSALFGTHAERRAEAELTQHFDQVLAGLSRDGGGGLGVEGPLSDPRFAQVYGGLYWQIDTPGGQGRSRSLWDATLPAVTMAEAPRFLRLPGPGGTPVLARVQRVALPPALGGGTAGITVALDARTIDAARRAFTADMLPYLGLLTLALIAAGSLQIHLGLRPLGHLRDRVGGLRRGQARRMGTQWPPEVQPLTREVDALLDQHEAEVRRAQDRAADLAHGLKTPLQAIIGEAERLAAAGQPRAAHSLTELVGRMRRQIDAELMRARLDAAEPGGCSDLARVARGVLDVLARVPEARALTLHCEIAAGTEVALAPDELAELIGALAENAVRHARSRVRLATGPEAAEGAGGMDGPEGAISLTISDDGPGLAPEHRARLLARGARLDEGGSGLGLSIARGIVARRGGSLALDAAPEGGLCVRLWLPRAGL